MLQATNGATGRQSYEDCALGEAFIGSDAKHLRPAVPPATLRGSLRLSLLSAFPFVYTVLFWTRPRPIANFHRQQTKGHRSAEVLGAEMSPLVSPAKVVVGW